MEPHPAGARDGSAGARLKSIPVVATAAAVQGSRYPSELEGTATLRDGVRVHVRPIEPADETRLVALFERLSPASVYQRFFAAHRRLPARWYRDFANVDYRTRLALVAEETTLSGVALRGVARWEPGDAPGSVELALVVEDAWQGRGLGTALLHRLLDAARARGFGTVCADVLAENKRMLRLLRRIGEIRQATLAHGVVHLCITPAQSPGLSASVAS